MEFRITTAHTPPRVYQYADAERALRKLRTMELRGVKFTLTDSLGNPLQVSQLENQNPKIS